MSIYFIYAWFALLFIFGVMLAFSLMEFAKRTVNPVSKKITLTIFFVSVTGIMVLVGVMVYWFIKATL